MYDIRSQKILGSVDPKDGVWSIPFEYEPDDSDLLSTRGSLYIVVDFEASPNIDLHLASKIIIDEIKEKYYGDLDGTPLQAIENAVISGKSKLQEIAESNKTAISNLNFSIVCAVVWGRVIYVAQVGDTACLIVRNGEVVDISNKTSGEVMTCSGLLESEDVVLIGTSTFENKFNNDSLLSSLGNLDSLFQSSSQACSLSAVIIRFKKSMVPSKKDIKNFISTFNPKSDDSKDASKDATAPLPKGEDTRVEAKQEAINTLSSDGFDSFESKGKSTRGRKPKKLLLSLLGFIFAASVFGLGYYMYSTGLSGINKTEPEIAVVDIDSYKKQFESLEDSSATVSDYESLKFNLERELSQDVSNDSILTLLDKVQAKIDDINNSSKAQSKNLFLDLYAKSTNARINKLTVAGENLLVSDIGAKKTYLYSLDSTAEESQEIAVSDNFLLAAYLDDSYYIINSDSLYTGESVSDLQEYALDTPLDSVQDLQVYFGNLYVLSNNVIYKYVLEGDTYVQSEWVSLDTSSSTSIAIDGNIYVASAPDILKYYTGEKEDYSLSDIPEDLTSPVFLSTSSISETLYALDKNSLYYIVKDTGTYEKQISIQELKVAPSGFVLTNNALYVSSGSRVFKVEL